MTLRSICPSEMMQPSEIIACRKVAPDEVPGLMTEADIMAWPGVGEAYGMVYLIAQAMGLPVAALETHGVPSVVRDGETGLLTAPGDAGGYAAALRRLIEEPDLRQRLGTAGAQWIRGSRTVDAAAAILRESLARAMEVAR